MTTRMRASILLALSCCLVGDSTATTVLVLLSRQVVVIAADSLSNRIEGGQRPVCKIAQTSKHMLFVATGTGVTDTPAFDPYKLAALASSNNRTPSQAAKMYAAEALEPLQKIWQSSRSRYLELAVPGEPLKGPQDFLFIGLNRQHEISIAGSQFDEDPTPSHVLRANKIRVTTPKQSTDVFLYRSGITTSIPSDAELEKQMPSVAPVAMLKGAIERQIEARQVWLAARSRS